MSASWPERTTSFTPEQVGLLVAAAVAAPSIHNSQPWLFRDQADRIEVHLDTRRSLAVADGSGREGVMSCGAALFNLRLAMAHIGHEPLVELLPDPDDPDHLATVVRGPARPATREEARLYGPIRRRRSYRRPFGPDAVPPAVLDELVDAAAQEDAALDAVTTPEDQLALIDLATLAARWLLADPAYRGELARWTRSDPAAGDGVKLAALGRAQYPVSGLPWALVTDPEVAVDELRKHPLFVLGTDGDARTDWLRAGQALQRVLLAATSRGLVASLFTQVAEVSATRSMLGHHLRLPTCTQAVLRLGYPAGGVPRSGRRRSDAVFLPDSGDAR